MTPIGIFHSESKFPYEARRQASEDGSLGEIHLNPGLEQALDDLDGFDRIWIIFQFHHNPEWKSKVMPPRGPRVKRGVFATRAPYRPNALGLSCVRLLKVEGLRVIVEGADLLDGTPVLDIKPYLPYADSFPDARVGWLEGAEAAKWNVSFSQTADRQIEWLENNGVTQLQGFIHGQLEFEPLDRKRKRVEKTAEGFCLSYRTWRVDFTADEEARTILVKQVRSGYTESELLDSKDPYGDKEQHRTFVDYSRLQKD